MIIMLFNSYAFIFLFLPFLLGTWQACACWRVQLLPFLLLFFSLAFYSFFGLPSLLLLLMTAGISYIFGRAIAASPQPRRKRLLACALTATMLPLLWFKYSLFFIQNLAFLLDASWRFTPPMPPPGISFYTFIQIAWLVGIYKGEFTTPAPGRHFLFSSCFPYVLSGPIVRYGQMGWQFDRLASATAVGLAHGFILFSLGLAKKALLADSLAPYANAIFAAAENGSPLTCAEAWLGSFFYTFQLYFDFSGYTDMALGIGLMLGLKLPENFNSPYKSTGIVDFWRRWHITLGSWLRDFLYIPLGGNRKGKPRQYLNLFLTMLIGGIWHGAGWTYIVWGALHGIMLAINHFFRACIKGSSLFGIGQPLPLRLISILFTFFCVNFCWVVFRAQSLDGALAMYTAMFMPDGSQNTIHFPGLQAWLPNHYINSWQPIALLCVCAGICWFMPASREIAEGGSGFLRWRPTPGWAAALAMLTFAALAMLARQSTFLYFQF